MERAPKYDASQKDSVGLYLDEIAKTPLLNAESEVELAKTIEAGLLARHILDGQADNHTGADIDELEWLAQEGERAKNQFIEANLRLVVSEARKYRQTEMPILDLIQEGNRGLVRAVEKFDYSKGYKFSTYAIDWILQFFQRGVVKQTRVVPLSFEVTKNLNRITEAKHKLIVELQREPLIDEIASEVNMDVASVAEIIDWSKPTVSLDMPVGEYGSDQLGDLIELDTTNSVEDEVLAYCSKDQIAGLIHMLGSKLDEEIIRMRFGFIGGKCFKRSEIAIELGKSPETVRQHEYKAIEKLRKLASPDLAAG